MPQGEFPAIFILDGEMQGQHYLLDSQTMTIGRDDICDITIPHREISRQHITLKHESDNQFVLHDLNSRNGTWVNGNRVEGTPVVLNDGDEIHIALVVRLCYVGYGITTPSSRDLPDVIPTSPPTKRLQIDTESHRVFIDGTELDPPLSFAQYSLLELLYLNANRICSRDEVVDKVWPHAQGEGVSEQAIDALVRRLRDRLADLAPHTQFVETVRGHGFRLNNPNPNR